MDGYDKALCESPVKVEGPDLTTLPQELIFAITDQLDSSPALGSFSQTCRLFNHIATPYLYTPPSVAGPKLRRFVEAVYKRKHEYTIRHLAIHIFRMTRSATHDSLRNLESLYVHGDQTCLWYWYNIAGTIEPPAGLSDRLVPPSPLTGWGMPALRSCRFTRPHPLLVPSISGDLC